MYAFDRDGCYIGDPHLSFADNHPSKIKEPSGQQVYSPVGDWIAKRGEDCILISNQGGCGPNGYTSVAACAEQFRHLMDLNPLLIASFFCPNEGQDCVGVFPGNKWEIFNYRDFPGLDPRAFRKPSGGMLKLAQRLGYPVTHYVGDLSGRPDYADGRDSDRSAAVDADVRFIDVRDLD